MTLKKTTIAPESENNDHVWRLVETNGWKITVEEIFRRNGNNSFITTYWDKQMELEIDRTVLGEFETSGGAMSEALEKINELIGTREL